MQGIIEGELDLETAIKRMPAEAKEFLNAPDKFAAAAGGWRSSKTVTLCVWGILLGRRIPNSLFLFGRQTRPSLDDTTRRTFLELCPREWVKDWRETKNQLVMRNGAEYLFRHLDLGDADVQGHIRGLDLTGFAVDQSEEIDEKAYLTLVGRLSRKTIPSAHFGRVVLNPAGHDWNWERFFKEDRSEAIRKRHKGYLLPTASNESNLPKDYIEDVIASYPADWTDRFIYGSFSDFSDLVYPEYNERIHVYDCAKEWPVFQGGSEPPKHWPTYVGIDIGGADPWGWTYGARDPETGNVFFFDEIYEANSLIGPLVEKHKRIMDGRREAGMAYDYENKQAAMELANHGVSGSPAVKDVRPGIFRMATYLHPDPRMVNPFTLEKPGPRMYISSKCANGRRELSNYKRAKDKRGNTTQFPQDGNDHWVDSARYMLFTLLELPPSPAEIEESERKCIDPMSSLYWADVEKFENQRQQPRRPRFYPLPTFSQTGKVQRTASRFIL